jgi:hypothetical protein
MFVQGEQLSVSSLSVIEPEEALLVLSAHARIEYVPADPKVTEGEVIPTVFPFTRAEPVVENA